MENLEKKYNEINIPIWKEHLRNMEKELEWYTPKITSDTTHYAITLEPRIHEDIYITMKTCMYYLNETNSNIKWGLQIFCGSENYDYFKDMVKDWGDVDIVNLGMVDLTKIEYNKLFRDVEFWKKVKGDKVFTFQLDSILLRSGIDEFLDYDYIGAPWRKPKEGSYVGNGGLSLRTRDVMLEISATNKVEEVIWEDIYFVKYLKGRGVADVDDAKRFSMEDIYHPNPLGVHYPIKYIEPVLLKKVLFKK